MSCFRDETTARGLRAGGFLHRFPQQMLHRGLAALFIVISLGYFGFATDAQAQTYRFSTVQVTGNQRIDPATILSYAGISRGQTINAAQLNDAYQRIVDSGLFEEVILVPRGGRLDIKVKEFPTINVISIEGNKRIKNADILKMLASQPRHVYSPTVAEADTATIIDAYRQAGRFAATVTPKIIRRSENRVDLVFEVTEGRVSEVERLSIIGNRAFSDSRLRRVLGTKQAGLLRAIIKSDTFIADRIEFDKQVLRDFYHSRGYVDFQVQSVVSEMARKRNGFFITFKVQEGQKFRFGKITTVATVPGVDAAEFQSVVKIHPGVVYSPALVDRTITRMERLATKKGMNFIRVKPRITRNDRDLTLDVEFTVERGPRVFVERIDIEGNATTLDRVIRRQFHTVEGDPFNPREIRDAAERIRALGFFKKAEVKAREGSSPEQVIIGVNVEEKPTGSLNFGAAYSTDTGAGLTIGFKERNFLGRGQALSFDIRTASNDRSISFNFVEPALLGRNLRFGIGVGYTTSNQSNSNYDTKVGTFTPSLEFPISENGRLQLRYSYKSTDLFGVDAVNSSAILVAEAARGRLASSGIGYSYSFDSRRTGLNPNAGVVFRFGQDYMGLGGDNKYIRTTALLGAETKIMNEEVTLRAIVEGGALAMISGDSRVTDRFFLGSSKLRGFEPNGMGPRDLGAVNQDALGGNMFASARLEAQFPLGLPAEYGITGGVFLDAGSVWGLDNVAGTGGPVDDAFHLRSSIGVSIFWTTAIGPLRFNFSRTLLKEPYDRPRNFDLTISTSF